MVSDDQSNSESASVFSQVVEDIVGSKEDAIRL